MLEPALVFLIVAMLLIVISFTVFVAALFGADVLMISFGFSLLATICAWISIGISLFKMHAL